MMKILMIIAMKVSGASNSYNALRMETQATHREGTSREYLATEPLGRLIARLAIPAMVANLTNLLYNMIDRIVVGHVMDASTQVIAGLGVCLPIIAIIMSFAMLAASGAAPLASMALGAGDYARAQRCVDNAQAFIVVISVVLMVVCYLFMTPLLYLFGASDATVGYAVEYLEVYLVGTLFTLIWQCVGLFLLAQGNSREMLIATASGAVLHVGLALLFVAVFGWGARGAAASSVISQVLCAAMVVYYLRRPSSALRFEFKFARPDWKLLGKIASVGSGRFFIMFSEGLLLMVVNSTLQSHGGYEYVSAMTVLYSLLSFVSSVAFGFGQGSQAIVSYCYGANKIDRSRRAAKIIVGISFAIDFVLTATIMAFPLQSAYLFTNDAALAELAASYAFTFFLGFLFFGAQLGMQTIFMGLGKGFCSLSVAAVRKVVLFIPLVLVLAQSMGVDGVYLAEPISDLGSVTFCTILFLRVIPKMFREREAASRTE